MARTKPVAVSGPPGDLVVDLDHTLIATDSLLEQWVALAFRQPLAALMLLVGLTGGRARFKAALAAAQPVDPGGLPFREELLDFLRLQKRAGRRLHLVTAADQTIAQAVAAHCDLFDTCEGSDGKTNLKGVHKASRLIERFPQGFGYAGDARADLQVWARAESIVIVGAGSDVARQARKLGKLVEVEFPPARTTVGLWPRALRLHQWAKNLLVFIPLMLSQKYLEPQAVLLSVVAFVALGLVASATYLINDLSDLAVDRRHPTKQLRPLAAGHIRIEHACLSALLLLIFGCVLAGLTSPALLAGLGAYAVVTLSYTFHLKRQTLLDVATLAALYALRIMIGAATIGAAQSFWLLTFALLFFFSISLAKRYAEIFNQLAAAGPDDLKGRGYRTVDGPVVLGLGIATSVASVLIVVLYLMEEAFPSNIYAQPNWLWAAPFLLMIWVARLWLVAGRGELDEDPVAFAIKDRFSWLLAAPLALAFVLATLA